MWRQRPSYLAQIVVLQNPNMMIEFAVSEPLSRVQSRGLISRFSSYDHLQTRFHDAINICPPRVGLASFDKSKYK